MSVSSFQRSSAERARATPGEAFRALPELAQPALAQVVREPFDECGSRFATERLRDERQVLVINLLLERARRRRNDDLPPRKHGGIRYASVLPVPVPASQRSTRLSASARSTALAICSCPGLVSYAVSPRASGPSDRAVRGPGTSRFAGSRGLTRSALFRRIDPSTSRKRRPTICPSASCLDHAMRARRALSLPTETSYSVSVSSGSSTTARMPPRLTFSVQPDVSSPFARMTTRSDASCRAPPVCRLWPGLGVFELATRMRTVSRGGKFPGLSRPSSRSLQFMAKQTLAVAPAIPQFIMRGSASRPPGRKTKIADSARLFRLDAGHPHCLALP
jgi:hypothetical protein